MIFAMNVALRLSEGELSFEDGIEPTLRRLFRRMWINRFKGFHSRDIGLYLGLDVQTTRYVSAGRKMSERGFHLRARVLFAILALMEPIGVRMRAEQLDALTTRDQDRYLNRGIQVYMLQGWPFRGRCWMFRQSRMRVWFALHEGVWGWDEAIEAPMKRRDWTYRRVIGPAGAEQFVSARAGAGQ
jgi:hypothetical protein